MLSSMYGGIDSFRARILSHLLPRPDNRNSHIVEWDIPPPPRYFSLLPFSFSVFFLCEHTNSKQESRQSSPVNLALSHPQSQSHYLPLTPHSTTKQPLTLSPKTHPVFGLFLTYLLSC